MVTFNNEPRKTEEFKYEFEGKSTDTKPTVTYAGRKIKNGSSFFEIDTQNVKFYDADTEAWV